jgi:hypothetical protein
MRRTTTILGGLLIFAVGYAAGTSQWSLIRAAAAFDDAQQAPAIELADETRSKIHEARLALQDAMGALESEGRYSAITDGLNAFLVLSGGGNAMEDLESGHGVDPETFAALYAGQAIPEVDDHLAKDDQGRLTYKGKVVRMYSQSRLEQSFSVRTLLTNPGL